MTTFTSRETVRDALAALFVANNSWDLVFGNWPETVSEMLGRSPILIIVSRGTQQNMAGLNMNPASYRFVLSTLVIAQSETDSSITRPVAMDEIDTLDKTLRQIIRDNASNANWTNIRFDTGYSTVEDILLNNTAPYMIESRTIYVDLASGAI